MNHQRKREYCECVREVEHGVFTPLVLSTCHPRVVWLVRQLFFYKQLAECVSQKQEESYSVVMGWLRCRISFAIC